MIDVLFSSTNKSGAEIAIVEVAFNNLYETLRDVCIIESRTFSIVKTKLEEASMYAKKSLPTVVEKN